MGGKHFNNLNVGRDIIEKSQEKKVYVLNDKQIQKKNDLLNNLAGDTKEELIKLYLEDDKYEKNSYKVALNYVIIYPNGTKSDIRYSSRIDWARGEAKKAGGKLQIIKKNNTDNQVFSTGKISVTVPKKLIEKQHNKLIIENQKALKERTIIYKEQRIVLKQIRKDRWLLTGKTLSQVALIGTGLIIEEAIAIGVSKAAITLFNSPVGTSARAVIVGKTTYLLQRANDSAGKLYIKISKKLIRKTKKTLETIPIIRKVGMIEGLKVGKFNVKKIDNAGGNTFTYKLCDSTGKLISKGKTNFITFNNIGGKITFSGMRVSGNANGLGKEFFNKVLNQFKGQRIYTTKQIKPSVNLMLERLGFKPLGKNNDIIFFNRTSILIPSNSRKGLLSELKAKNHLNGYIISKLEKGVNIPESYNKTYYNVKYYIDK